MNDSLSKNWVDTHFHVFEAGQARTGARYVPQYAATIEDWQKCSSSAGISHGVCVQPSFLGTDNRLLLQTLSRFEGFLRGIAVVNPNAPETELDALHASGVRGIRLNLVGLSHEIADWSSANTVWDAMLRLGWNVEVHTDQGRLPEVLKQLPGELPLVVDHMTKPMAIDATDVSVATLVRRSKTAPTFVKLSGAYRLNGLNAAKTAHLLMDELGPASILWGSDWPCTNHEQFAHYSELISAMQGWVDSVLVEQVMVRNPMGLYWGSG